MNHVSAIIEKDIHFQWYKEKIQYSEIKIAMMCKTYMEETIKIR